METLVSLGCTPDGENILRKKSVEGVLLERIEQPKEGLFSLDRERVDQLAKEIKKDGLVYPVLLTELPGPFPTMHEILDGQHRVAAVKKLYLEAVASGSPSEIGKWNRIPAIIGENLETEEAKNLYRIKVNLERNTYSAADHAKYVAEKARLEGIVRKGNSKRQKTDSRQENLTVNLTIKGQGVISPAMQLAESLGVSRNTMVSRFKEWSAEVGYQGPMSSVEGDDIKALSQFCADYEAAKEAKKTSKKESTHEKQVKQRERIAAEQKAKARDALLALQAMGFEIPGIDLVLQALGVGGAA